MIELYVLAAIVGVIIISREWKRSQERQWDQDDALDPYGEKPKRKNVATLASRIRLFLEPDPFTQGHYTENPALRAVLWVAKLVYITMISFSFAVMLVPLVRWIYNIPSEYEGPLEEYSSDANTILGFSFFLILIIFIAFLRHLPWRVWHVVLVGSFIGFIVLMILYEIAV